MTFQDSLIQLAQSLLYDRAMVQIRGEWAGALAAIPKASDPNPTEPDLNYGEIFIRDNVPVMIYLLTQGKYSAVRHFLETCLSLQSNHPQTRGIFPTSFIETEQQVIADYGQRAIGRVTSVDATLWWSILAHAYVQRSGDRAFALQANVQQGLQKFLNLILHPTFRGAPTLFVPDGAFMIDRALDVWGAPLEIQALLYGSLLSAAGLIQIALQEQAEGRREIEPQRHKDTKNSSPSTHPPIHPSTSPAHAEQLTQFYACLDYAHRLRRYLLKHYWINSKTVQVLRRRPTEQYGDAIENEYNIQTETIPHWLQDWLGDRGGYLIGNIRTGRPDFRFFSLGNCLGGIFDILSSRQQQALFRLILQNRQDLIAQMPLRICHPPLEDVDWREKTGYDRKNLPWCYHNAGHWPCLSWFLVVAVLRQQPSHADLPLMAEMQDLLKYCYRLLIRQLPRQSWAEYFDGPTGSWMGQQARLYQTWTIVGFLLVHHFLEVNPADANILDVPHIKTFRQDF